MVSIYSLKQQWLHCKEFKRFLGSHGPHKISWWAAFGPPASYLSRNTAEYDHRWTIEPSPKTNIVGVSGFYHRFHRLLADVFLGIALNCRLLLLVLPALCGCKCAMSGSQSLSVWVNCWLENSITKHQELTKGYRTLTLIYNIKKMRKTSQHLFMSVL